MLKKIKINIKLFSAVLAVLLIVPTVSVQAAGVSSFVCSGTIMNKVAGELLKKIGGGLLGSVTGGGEVPTNDSDARAQLGAANKYQDLIDCAQESLTKLNQDYTSNFINNVLSNYTITNYLNYSKNLAYKVYVAEQLKNADPQTDFILRKNIQKLIDNQVNNADLEALYKKRSLDAANINVSAFGDVVSSNALDGLDDPFQSTVIGQRLSAQDAASVAYSNALAAANSSISNGQGKKDAFDCKVDQITQKTSCAVKYPAQYVTSQLDSKIAGLFGEQVKPQRNVSALTTFITKFASLKLNLLSNQILDLVQNKKDSTADNSAPVFESDQQPPL
jgi:hypothetical protein